MQRISPIILIEHELKSIVVAYLWFVQHELSCTVLWHHVFHRPPGKCRRTPQRMGVQQLHSWHERCLCPSWRERWSWWGRRYHHQQTAWTPHQYGGCSPHDPARWSRGSCWVRGGHCLRPDCMMGCPERRGNPQGRRRWWSYRRRTDLWERWRVNVSDSGLPTYWVTAIVGWCKWLMMLAG